jgi:fructose-1,6-bisphosphatase/inositol monophosphatase family enzyme
MPKSISYRLAEKVATEVRPLLNDPERTRAAAAVTADKGEGHTAHKIDDVAEEVLLRELRALEFDGTLYSEEAGLVRFGDGDRVIVTDPYCNTTLTFRGVRESAVAVYEYTRSGDFRSGAIADIQIPRVLWATDADPVTMTYPGFEERPVRCATTDSVAEAFLVVSALKRNRRTELPRQLLTAPKLLSTVDGAIVGLRLAVGEIDGFVDHLQGQPSYETLAYEMVVRAGGTVTDANGAPIDFAEIVRALSAGEVSRHPIVAAANEPLHREILALL